MTAEEWIPGMVEVTQRDANNYCRVLTALGMEEEGDPVAEIERLRAENAALKREAYTWWQLAASAPQDERKRCVALCNAQAERWADDRARYAALECAKAIQAQVPT